MLIARRFFIPLDYIRGKQKWQRKAQLQGQRESPSLKAGWCGAVSVAVGVAVICARLTSVVFVSVNWLMTVKSQVLGKHLGNLNLWIQYQIC